VKKKTFSFHQTLQGRPDYAYCLRMKKEAETMQRKRKIGDLEVGLYDNSTSSTSKLEFSSLLWVTLITLPQLSKFENIFLVFYYFGQ
jgi:hypothetical protein